MITGALPTEVKDHLFSTFIQKHYNIKDIIQIHMTPIGEKVVVEVMTKEGTKMWKYKLRNGNYEPIEEIPLGGNDR